jgi:hypothetical protein
MDQVRLRNLKNEELGNIIAANGSTSESLPTINIFHDGLEFLMQKLNQDEQVPRMNINSQYPTEICLVRK